jgi:hypothetical protein
MGKFQYTNPSTVDNKEITILTSVQFNKKQIKVQKHQIDVLRRCLVWLILKFRYKENLVRPLLDDTIYQFYVHKFDLIFECSNHYNIIYSDRLMGNNKKFEELMKDPKRMKRLMEDAFRKVDIDGSGFLERG